MIVVNMSSCSSRMGDAAANTCMLRVEEEENTWDKEEGDMG